MSAEGLQIFHQQFQPLFQRWEQRKESWLYVCGRLSDLERKPVEPMVLKLIGPDLNAIRRLQQFIGQGEWDAGSLIIQAQSLVSAWMGEDDGVVIVDGSGFPKELTHLTGMRWPIETALEEGKGEVGLDHFETRTWPGWHHHMVQSFLAYLFLLRLRLLFPKKPRPHYIPGTSIGGRGR